MAVEFIHPIIVGKRALPALDVGPDFASRLPILLQPQDVAMGFAFPDPDAAAARALQAARERGALTFALAGGAAEYPFALPDQDPSARKFSRFSTTSSVRPFTCISSIENRDTTWEPPVSSIPRWPNRSSGSGASSRRCRPLSAMSCGTVLRSCAEGIDQGARTLQLASQVVWYEMSKLGA
jgi:hypothetical protein